MRKTAYLLVLIMISSCNYNSKKQIEVGSNQFTISATIENLKDSLVVVLSNLDWRNRDFNIIDSTYSSGGRFNFKGHISNPSLHNIMIKDYKNRIGKSIKFWFENGEIAINGNYDEFENSTIMNSPLNELYNHYLKLEYTAHRDFIFKNPNNYFSLSKLMEYPELVPADSLKLFYSKLNNKLKESENGITLNNYISLEKTQIGDHYIDFEAKDLEGNIVKLSDFKGKIILLDFWATWCQFCRIQNKDEFAYLNKKYQKDDVVIISYSLDTKKELWEKSSKFDNIDWINISNIKGMNDPVATRFNLRALPQSFLFDKTGIMVEIFEGYDSENNTIEQAIDKLINK